MEKGLIAATWLWMPIFVHPYPIAPRFLRFLLLYLRGWTLLARTESMAATARQEESCSRFPTATVIALLPPLNLSFPDVRTPFISLHPVH